MVIFRDFFLQHFRRRNALHEEQHRAEIDFVHVSGYIGTFYMARVAKSNKAKKKKKKKNLKNKKKNLK